MVDATGAEMEAAMGVDLDLDPPLQELVVKETADSLDFQHSCVFASNWCK